jgi:ABC-type Fe3+-hydroxamate transport system substrate-binding protein
MDLGHEYPLVDAAGVRHEPARETPRIVSLVPSLTELICDLGLATQLVGRTGFCVHPRAVVRKVPKVGGTKSVNLKRLRELAPTHVVVNIDENEKPTVDEISRFVPHVVVTHPLQPRDNLGLYRLLGGIFRRDAEAATLARRFEEAWDDITRHKASFSREPVLYLIWKEPWMTVARDTYISATLAAVGWDTVPEASSERYPPIALDAAVSEGARRVLLPSEPYRFRERDAAEIRSALPAHVRVTLIDGEMTSWYGSRAIAGLRYLPEFRSRMVAVEFDAKYRETNKG